MLTSTLSFCRDLTYRIFLAFQFCLLLLLLIYVPHNKAIIIIRLIIPLLSQYRSNRQYCNGRYLKILMFWRG